MNTPNREYHLENTGRKHISLTLPGEEKIQTWADAQGLTFSAAIEALALKALEEEMNEQTQWQFGVMRQYALKTLKAGFDRLARLLLVVVYDVRYCKLLLETITLQIVRQTAELHPRDFDEVMQVSTDRRKSPDAQIRQTYTEWKEWVQMESKRDVRKAIRQALLELMAEDETDEETTAVGA